MTDAPRIKLPKKLIPVFVGEADVRGAYGGRGSGKTRSLAKMTAVRGLMWAEAGREGIILCGRQYMNSLDESSMAEVKAAIKSEPWLEERYEIGEKFIRTKDGRVEYKFAGLDRNIASVKSKSRILLCWVDEAEPVSEEAWQILIPTLREEDSELWVTWNPQRKTSATHKRFRETKDPRTKVVELNWRDNPKFPAILERARLKDKAERPDSYGHIWEGAFETIVEGAYFAGGLTRAKEEGRIGRVAADPLMTIRLFVDIGGTGARADAFAMWATQFIGKEIRVLDYYESVGQPLATHIEWMRSRGYTPDRAQIWLPHDGATQDKVFDVSYESALRAALYQVTVVPNQGKGAAKARIEAVRRLFPSMWFNADTTEGGREALGWYHEKKDEVRGIGLGPEHDWASHGCFHPRTKVLTRYGTCRIMDLPITGEVLTPCGWKRYIHPRITKTAAQLVEVVFTGGYSVKCTPDHLFLTVSGWKSAESLTMGSQILSSLTNSRSISKALSTVCGQVTVIFQKVAAGFIETFGRLHSGRYLPDVMCITGMETSPTTCLATLSASTQRNIYGLIAEFSRFTEKAVSATLHVNALRSGTALRLEESGTADRQSDPSRGRSGNASRSAALSAALSSWLLFARVEIRRFIVRRLAKLLRIASAASKTNGLLTIESVRRLSETADVWDITVPDGHWFSLDNGAVVHNSDAFGLMAVVYKPPRLEVKEQASWRDKLKHRVKKSRSGGYMAS